MQHGVDGFTIGEVERMSGTPATTLRYYERRGLIAPPARRAGQRRYEPAVFATLMVIRFCRIAGLSLDEIEQVLADRSPGREVTRRLALERIDRIDEQIAQLRLAQAMMRASATCVCPTVERCDCGAMEPVLRKVRRLSGQPV